MLARNKKMLAEFDVSNLIGLKVVVVNAAHEVVDEVGDITVEVDDTGTLEAASAIVRCLMAPRLLAAELQSIRKIAGMTAINLANKMGEKTSHETISRWENGKQPMSGYAEKVFRLVICEALRERAPGVGYRDGAIANLIQIDPWQVNPDYELPAIVMERVRVKVHDAAPVTAWVEEPKAAA